MALWGNSDNVGSIGTVTLDYSNRVVSGWAGTATGLGVSFGESGYAQVGDTISFGQHGTGTYFGEAVIASIGSTLQVTIASTVALNGSAIAGVNYTISQKPTWIPTDPHWNINRDTDTSLSVISGKAGDPAGIVTADAASGVGTDIIYVSAASTYLQTGNTLLNSGTDIAVSAIAATTVSLGTTIGTAIAVGAALTFKEWTGGYDAFVYGVSGIGASSALASSKQYITNAGWVGVTTYNDNLGNLRVKKETLVAMSGITTGNAPAYPPEYD